MITKKIFLASSTELRDDRNEFEIFIYRKTKDWVAKGAFIELIIWEDFLDAMSQTRLQDEYNKAIRECDIFVMLFWTKVGQYTEEEFETAFGQFKATNKPLIFTYFKNAEVRVASLNQKDLTSVWAFQEKLKSLGHFYTVYKNVEELKLNFYQQLDKLSSSPTFLSDYAAARRSFQSDPAAKRSVQVSRNPRVPWTEEQWASAAKVIDEESSRARVAATFLPRVEPPPDAPAAIDGTPATRLATLQVKVLVSGAEMADPEGTLRHAASVLARLEDAVVFGGLVASRAPPPPFAPPDPATAKLPEIWEILNGEVSEGIVGPPHPTGSLAIAVGEPRPSFRGAGALLVRAISGAVGQLETNGQYGPFTLVLGNDFFTAVQTPDPASLMLPKDRITPFLGSGGAILRSSILPVRTGVVIALGGAPIGLIASDVSLDVQQVGDEPRFVFRVFEKMRLRIKRPQAIAILEENDSSIVEGNAY